jgi:hypothetical protein
MSVANVDAVKKQLSEAAKLAAQSDAMTKRILDSALARLAVVADELNSADGEKYESLLTEKGTLEQVIATERKHMAAKS